MQVRRQRAFGDRACADRSDHVARVYPVADLDADVLAEIGIERAASVCVADADRPTQRIVLPDALHRAGKHAFDRRAGVRLDIHRGVRRPLIERHGIQQLVDRVAEYDLAVNGRRRLACRATD